MTTLLVDGNNLVMRAQFAMRRSGLSAHGVLTGPTMVTINGLGRLVAEVKPARALVVFDGGASAWRRAIDPEYKAHRSRITPEEQQNRESTFMLVREFLKLIRMEVRKEADTEADDLIAGAWAALKLDEDDKIVIASSDKDFLQLLGPNPNGVETEQIRFSSADTKTDWWTRARFLEEHGWDPQNWPLVTALTGDTVDGVAGVPGIGPKRAVKLLGDAGWDLAKAQVEVGRTKPGAVARIPVDLQLVDLRSTPYRVRTTPWRPPTEQDAGWDQLLAYLERYELQDIRTKLLSGALWRPSGAQRALPGRPLGKR